MALEIVDIIWVCTDCMLWYENREQPQNTDCQPWEQLPEIDVTSTSQERVFSKERCPACGSTLAGSRFEYAVWEEVA